MPNALQRAIAILMCKRYNNLKDKILSLQNFIEAEYNARKGKNHTYGVQRFDRRDDLTLENIIDSMKDCNYRTSDYHIFKIYEPKERLIYQLPYYPDRIVHHSIMNVMEPIFVKWFISNSYACIKERGIHKMASDIERVLYRDKTNTVWCLKLDIHKFYPNIVQDELINTMKQKIKDKWLLQILSEIICSTDRGVPIGNYLSQFFANAYLNKIDHWIKEVLKVKYYYRYCDDIVILGKDTKTLYKIYRLVNQKLSFIGLYLKKPRLFPTDCGIDFVGYVFRHNYTLLRKKMKLRFKKAVRKYNTTGYNKYKRKISSYYGWLAHCDGIHLLKSNIKDLYYGFKKHYFKNCGIRTRIVGRRRKTTTK